jgi:quercetin 2,3-dioxygenase
MRFLASILVALTAIALTTIYNTTTTPQDIANLATRAFSRTTKSITTTTTNSFHRSISNMTAPRTIQKTFLAREQSEGAGARVRRSIGTMQQKHLSPFLMLDHFNVPYGAGFPDHPHRGQETITYLMEGSVDHEDFAGNKGTINTGDLQFMTAGRGIMHAEMPGKNSETNVGLQLWVDLPKHLKYTEPRYRDLRAEEIPLATSDDKKVSVKVISGRSLGIDSVKDLAYTPVWFLDVTVQPGGTFTQEIPDNWNAFVYTFSGLTSFKNGSDFSPVQPYHNAIFSQKGDSIVATVEEGASEPGHFILVAGEPQDQEIVQYGPFVVNSRQEVMQALTDFQTHSNGFERAENWESEIGKSMGRVH